MRISDWSSDVCSSDLPRFALIRKTPLPNPPLPSQGRAQELAASAAPTKAVGGSAGRSLRPDGLCQQLVLPVEHQRAVLEQQRDEVEHVARVHLAGVQRAARSEEHTSELQSLMRN